MVAKDSKIEAWIFASTKDEVRSMCELLRVSEAEYVRGAIESRLKRDRRKFGVNKDG